MGEKSQPHPVIFFSTENDDRGKKVYLFADEIYDTLQLTKITYPLPKMALLKMMIWLLFPFGGIC